jgi:predicted nuclease of predicted toxin-antitoxin system
MRFLADENTDARVIKALRADGHDVVSVAEAEPGISDEKVLEWANRESRILITEDLDFGELIFRDAMPCYGLLQLRIQGIDTASKIARVLFAASDEELQGQLTTVSETDIRKRRL